MGDRNPLLDLWRDPATQIEPGNPWAVAPPEARPRQEIGTIRRPPVGDPWVREAVKYVGPDAAAQGAYGGAHALTSIGADLAHGNVGEETFKNLPGALAIFLGGKAKNAKLPELHKAMDMVDQGVPRHDVLRETGWYSKPDGWRWEADDRNAKFTRNAKQVLDSNTGQSMRDVKMSDIFTHPKLYEAHPDIADIPASLVTLPHGASFKKFQQGGFMPEIPGISTESISVKAQNGPQARKIVLHELQHAVQADKREHFEPGASPMLYMHHPNIDGYAKGIAEKQGLNWDAIPQSEKDSIKQMVSFQLYKATKGEVEANNVMARRAFSPQYRIEQPPWATEPVREPYQVSAPKIQFVNKQLWRGRKLGDEE